MVNHKPKNRKRTLWRIKKLPNCHTYTVFFPFARYLSTGCCRIRLRTAQFIAFNPLLTAHHSHGPFYSAIFIIKNIKLNNFSAHSFDISVNNRNITLSKLLVYAPLNHLLLASRSRSRIKYFTLYLFRGFHN